MDDFYEIEEIIGSRTNKGVNQYLVRWAGYDESEDTWEPEKTLIEDCPDKLKAYLARIGLKRNELPNGRLSATPPVRPSPASENGMQYNVTTSETQQITAVIGATQTVLNTPIRKFFDALDVKEENNQKLNDSLDREIEKLTSTHSKKKCSFSEKYFILQFFKEVVPLFILFCVVLTMAFLVPFLHQNEHK